MRTIELVAKWMILTELKKKNERDKHLKQTQSLNNDRAQGRRASKKSGGNKNARTPRDKSPSLQTKQR